MYNTKQCLFDRSIDVYMLFQLQKPVYSSAFPIANKASPPPPPPPPSSSS